ncbi:Transcription factor IIIA [Harpegnathos saltator]|uniref:Transcription factor IIIA n=2 Tax=Harpegnathos saltator TaxID=610380 RepID=E2C177_HARSA|nr:Transcription factor IIIA [Harpegnathos saltator]
MQPGPSSESDPCGEPPTKGSNINKYNKIPKQCDNCKQIFRKKPELIDHYEKIHQRCIHRCKYCNYETNRKSDLKRHEKTHIRKRPISSDYVCTEPGCNKNYKNIYSLEYHIMTCHHKNKKESSNAEPGPSSENNPYGELLSTRKIETYKVSRQCRICGQIFHNKHMLIDHSMNVHQRYVHICEKETCNYETNKLYSMRRHFIRQHMDNKN